MNAEEAPRLITRRTARVILIDQAERVLLFGAAEPDANGIQREVWVLPGGGAEDSESMAEAAVRELAEETGLRVTPADLRGPVARSRGRWSGGNVTRWAEDEFFFLRVAAWSMTPDDLDPLERAQAIRHRWWTVAALLETDTTIFPRDLAPLVVRLLAGDDPQPPVELPW